MKDMDRANRQQDPHAKSPVQVFFFRIHKFHPH